MDIAKYMATALLLSSTFGDMNNPLTIIICGFCIGNNTYSRIDAKQK